ncbi:pyridoxal phosphate-dependent aminotransferase [Edwardsiella tarda]|uniref:pyridoxal phosphate-dependent aminotransferase n=1 Tax=Edwardsiella tarda TaxID=636 RepID=UPI003A8A6165
MSFENSYIKDIEPYKLASHKVWDEISNEGILKLDWNEATIPASPEVKKRILETIEKIGFRYYPNVKNLELISSIAKYTQVNTANVQYFPSSDTAHEYIASVFLSINDRVLILGPTYDNFRLACQAKGSEIIYANCYDDDFNLQNDLYIRQIEQVKPKLAYICNPNNPTGSKIEREYIAYLLERFPDILFVIDEAYIEFSVDSCSTLLAKYQNMIVSRTFSKAFALANFRIGYLLASEVIIDVINKIRNAKNVTTLSQEAAIGALMDFDYTRSYIDEVVLARDFFRDEINSKFKGLLFAYESSGNFTLIKCNSSYLKQRLIVGLEERDIFVRNLAHKGLSELYVRITIGTRGQMRRVIDAITDVINHGDLNV